MTTEVQPLPDIANHSAWCESGPARRTGALRRRAQARCLCDRRVGPVRRCMGGGSALKSSVGCLYLVSRCA